MAAPFILVVDDDEFLSELVLQTLHSAGYEGRAVGDGQQMMAFLHQRRPDMIILDAQMPVMDGYQALAALRADKTLAHLPVLMMTALRSPEHIIRLRDLGIEGYVVKPFDTRVLLERVKTIATRQKKISDGAAPSAPSRTGSPGSAARPA